MANFPIPFNTDEKILREEDKAIHVKNNALGIGYNIIYGTLWLTNQRILFHSTTLGYTLAYPIAHITFASRAEINISHKKVESPVYNSYVSWNAGLKLDFDDSGEEYFIPSVIDEWAAAINSAKVDAPILPFTQTPPRHSALKQGSRRLWIIIGVMAIIVVVFICAVTACLGSTFFAALMTKGGG